jgi:curved DNA-binding protein CbpA
MNTPPPADFVDFYELLQVSPNAEADTIQRVFRLLAQRFHPDNKESGNEQMFQQLLKAYQVLSDPERRAAFDALHRAHVKLTWEIFDQSAASQGLTDEKKKREGILGVLYRKRMQCASQPGMNVREIEDLTAIPREHQDFTLWYLKERGDIRVGDNGRFMITVQGVDSYESISGPVEDVERKNLYMLPAARQQPA